MQFIKKNNLRFQDFYTKTELNKFLWAYEYVQQHNKALSYWSFLNKFLFDDVYIVFCLFEAFIEVFFHILFFFGLKLVLELVKQLQVCFAQACVNKHFFDLLVCLVFVLYLLLEFWQDVVLVCKPVHRVLFGYLRFFVFVVKHLVFARKLFIGRNWVELVWCYLSADNKNVIVFFRNGALARIEVFFYIKHALRVAVNGHCVVELNEAVYALELFAEVVFICKLLGFYQGVEDVCFYCAHIYANS